MTYSVHQHWDPLKVCIVGRSYSPEFYSFIPNPRVRTVMEQIARETEEDYQKLILLLENFGVKVLRPNVSDNYLDHIVNDKISTPPMTPRDYSIMLGKDFYFKSAHALSQVINEWNTWRGPSWPINPPSNYKELQELPDFVKNELRDIFIGYDISLTKKNLDFDINVYSALEKFMWKPIIDHIQEQGNTIFNIVPKAFNQFNSACTTRVGKDIYAGTTHYQEDKTGDLQEFKSLYPNYRWHIVNTGGHSDGTYCPVVPGLIVSLQDIPTYKNTFPGWEVVYLPGQSWARVKPFLDLKHKNNGKWWVPGEELNDEFTEFVESWLSHWVGYVEETVFDVNMLVIDKKNVVCNNYNKDVFDAFERHGITPHIVNFRHRFFWDGGLHCITSDLHREGVIEDYFPDRNND